MFKPTAPPLIDNGSDPKVDLPSGAVGNLSGVLPIKSKTHGVLEEGTGASKKKSRFLPFEPGAFDLKTDASNFFGRVGNLLRPKAPINTAVESGAVHGTSQTKSNPSVAGGSSGVFPQNLSLIRTRSIKGREEDLTLIERCVLGVLPVDFAKEYLDAGSERFGSMDAKDKVARKICRAITFNKVLIRMEPRVWEKCARGLTKEIDEHLKVRTIAGTEDGTGQILMHVRGVLEEAVPNRSKKSDALAGRSLASANAVGVSHIGGMLMLGADGLKSSNPIPEVNLSTALTSTLGAVGGALRKWVGTQVEGVVQKVNKWEALAASQIQWSSALSRALYPEHKDALSLTSFGSLESITPLVEALSKEAIRQADFKDRPAIGVESALSTPAPSVPAFTKFN